MPPVNENAVITRSQAMQLAHRLHQDRQNHLNYVSFHSEEELMKQSIYFIDAVPTNYREAEQSPESKGWIAAVF